MKAKVLLAVFFLWALGVVGQDNYPRAQVFGAYSLLNNSVGPNRHLNGWLAGAEYDPWNHIGAEAELSGGYGSGQLRTTTVSSSAYSLNFGPRVFFNLPLRRNHKRNTGITLFAHVLAGATHFSSNDTVAPASRTGFSWIPGGGAEFHLSDSWAFRVNLDILRSSVFGFRLNSPRTAIGVVHSFGMNR